MQKCVVFNDQLAVIALLDSWIGFEPNIYINNVTL